MSNQMYAATREQDDGVYIYTPVTGRYGRIGTEEALEDYCGGGSVHVYIVRGDLDDAPEIEGYDDPSPVLAEGYYDAADSDESMREFAARLFDKARDAA